MQKRGKVIVGITVIIVGVLVLALLLLMKKDNNSMESVVESYIKIYEGDVDGYIDAIPKEVLERYIEKMNKFQTLDDYKKQSEGLIKELEDTYGKDYTIIHIKDQQSVIDTVNKEEIIQRYQERYHLNVLEAKQIWTKIRMKGSKKEEQTSLEIYVVKIGKKWYIDGDSILFMWENGVEQ